MTAKWQHIGIIKRDKIVRKRPRETFGLFSFYYLVDNKERFILFKGD